MAAFGKRSEAEGRRRLHTAERRVRIDDAFQEPPMHLLLILALTAEPFHYPDGNPQRANLSTLLHTLALRALFGKS
jgi:hypothetical protein